jgi:hypothetical protein
LNKWNQFKRYIFLDPSKNIWLKRFYFFIISLNFKCEVYGSGADAFLLKSFFKQHDYLGVAKESHILFLAGDLDLSSECELALLKEKIKQLRFPRFVFVFGAIAGRNVTNISSKKLKGDFYIPGGNYVYENLQGIKKIVLNALALHPEKNQEKYDQME